MQAAGAPGPGSSETREDAPGCALERPGREDITAPHRRIDHLVHAVRDLEAAAALYQRLGFRVGARNRHPWGTENRLIQLRASFIELITVAADQETPPHDPGRFSFGRFIHDYLQEREGIAMLALDSTDARADAARFAEAGLGAFAPFHFGRTGRRPDGSETRVAFTLAFACDPGVPSAAFFACQHHFPESFWDPAFQMHPNGATHIPTVTIASPDPAARSEFLSILAETDARPRDGGIAFPLGNAGGLAAVTGDAGIAAYSVAVADPAALAAELRAAAIPHEGLLNGITLRGTEAHGVEIRLISADG